MKKIYHKLKINARKIFTPTVPRHLRAADTVVIVCRQPGLLRVRVRRQRLCHHPGADHPAARGHRHCVMPVAAAPDCPQ